jgi:hypothetical protein
MALAAPVQSMHDTVDKSDLSFYTYPLSGGAKKAAKI